MTIHDGPAVSGLLLRAYRSVDLDLGLLYQPPDGEDLDGLIIAAALHAPQGRTVPADTVEFDTDTGEIVAKWQEATTAKLSVGTVYEARFVRKRDGDTRVFYIIKVLVG